MQENLVIVESPAKAKTIEKFLGEGYKVMSSYGHIRDLKKRGMGVNLDNLTPEYEIPEEKNELVVQLRANAKKAKAVWLASDEDREGEAISWHLAQVLGLDLEHTKRIVFHEITKKAILNAIENPRTIDINLVNAQQARRVLDRIVGFKLSPILWRKLRPSLSAGRVQSVSVRLIVEREREIEAFQSESSYKVDAVFITTTPSGLASEFRAELNTRFKTKEEAEEFLLSIKGKQFSVTEISQRPLKKTPAPPFTTSTLQQEAARKLGFTVSQTMIIAQRLYESGLITYMRTDSVNLSTLCLAASKEEVTKQFGAEYSKTRNYHTSSKGAQEAHEAIRPTYIDQNKIQGNPQDCRLYELIWKRTMASQMSDAEVEKTTAKISIEGTDLEFIATGEVVMFDGFLRLYRESVEDEDENGEEARNLPNLTENQKLDCLALQATQRYTQAPLRYTEASLVRKLEELGIGRPSTYAPTISTIQQRDYVQKGNKAGEKRKYTILTLGTDGVTETEKTEQVGVEKAKLMPTDIGVVVNDFLTQYFPDIMDYNFTANVEKEFDEIAEGNTDWRKVIKDFYGSFEPLVEATLNDKSDRRMGERILGTDPKTGKQVSVKIGRFGPVAQVGVVSDSDKPRFAQLRSDQSLHNITLEEALELFKLPRQLGKYESEMISVGSGRFGPYISHSGKYVSIPAGVDPLTITYDEAIKLIEGKRQSEEMKHLKRFEEEPELEIRQGRYGPYISYKGANYHVPKDTKIEDITFEQCMETIKKQAEEKTTNARQRRPRTKTKDSTTKE